MPIRAVHHRRDADGVLDRLRSFRRLGRDAHAQMVIKIIPLTNAHAEFVILPLGPLGGIAFFARFCASNLDRFIAESC